MITWMISNALEQADMTASVLQLGWRPADAASCCMHTYRMISCTCREGAFGGGSFSFGNKKN